MQTSDVNAYTTGRHLVRLGWHWPKWLEALVANRGNVREPARGARGAAAKTGISRADSAFLRRHADRDLRHPTRFGW